MPDSQFIPQSCWDLCTSIARPDYATGRWRVRSNLHIQLHSFGCIALVPPVSLSTVKVGGPSLGLLAGIPGTGQLWVCLPG